MAIITIRSFFVALITFFMTAPALAQAPEPWGVNLQRAFSPVKHRIESFHDMMLYITAAIVAVVFALLLIVAVRFNARANPTPSKTTHNVLLEVIWTAIPVLVLVVIIVPSLRLLYYTDKTTQADMTIKVTGHQWYWSYQYPDHGAVEFDSTMIQDKDIKPGQLRLLDVDESLVLPVGANIRILVTAADVIHAFTVPSLGFKIDAVPGVLNETWTRIEKPGMYYGQCSEICGAGHAFMPVAIKAVSPAEFAAWIKDRGGAMPAVKTSRLPRQPDHQAFSVRRTFGAVTSANVVKTN